ncbi:small-subunit processome [Peziza echinospora]|nr:small-subunit processome [Peziza echinospora]
MSSMRNAVQRRNHKERVQPVERQKWGLLEKKKDYRLRARDYNAKKATLKALAEKAASRNPDEFYYNMINSKTKKGIHVADRGNKALDIDTVKLLKTQDAGYLRMKSAVERKTIERLEINAAMLEGSEAVSTGKRRKHTVFVESKAEASEFNPAEYFDTVPELVDRAVNRPRKEQLMSIDLKQQMAPTTVTTKVARKLAKLLERKKREKERVKTLQELTTRIKRKEELEKAERALEIQRDKMGKGVGKGKPGQWGRERKK